MIKISLVTATWNCVDTIYDCLASVRGQSYCNIEHIIIDGASTDGTLDVLCANRMAGSVLISEPDGGIYHALNKGIFHATGDIIGFLHADDVFANPHVIANIAKAFENSQIAAVYGDLHYVQHDDLMKVVRYWKSSPFCRRKLEWGWMPPHPTLYIRREWYIKIGGFNTEYRISADYLSILMLFSMPNFRPAYLPEVFVNMRIGGISNRSLKNILCKSREDLRALRSVGVGIWGGIKALVWKNFGKLGQFFRWQ